MAVAGLIMATEPLLAVLLLGQLGFAPWQYGLAFALPCLGGLIGSRLARRVVNRYGEHRVFRTVGTLRAVWLIGLVFVRPGLGGLAIVIAVELAIIINMSLYSPVLATYRLAHTPRERVARTLSAWSIGQQASIAIFTALGGLLAVATSPRTALGVAGLLILATPLLLPRERVGSTSVTPTAPAPRRSGRLLLILGIGLTRVLPFPDQAIDHAGERARAEGQADDPEPLGPVVGRDDRRPPGDEHRDRDHEAEEDRACALQVTLLFERIRALADIGDLGHDLDQLDLLGEALLQIGHRLRVRVSRVGRRGRR